MKQEVKDSIEQDANVLADKYVSGLDYAGLWKTLMRTGIKQRFSQLRQDFFMKIATDGKMLFRGYDDLDRIIIHSKVFELLEKNFPEVKNIVKQEILPEDTFKHYAYTTPDDGIYIEYFVNVDNGMRPEAVRAIFGKEEDVDASCSSYEAMMELLKLVPDDAENEEESSMVSKRTTLHVILVGEGSTNAKGEKTVTPDNYPGIVKHELTHACLFELCSLISHSPESFRTPITWTDAELIKWGEDLHHLHDVLRDKQNDDAMYFREFVSEFLMYESDEQTKEKNPVEESRVPKTSKPDAKPRVTYRTLTPLDRFEEALGRYDEDYQKAYEKIIAALRPFYDDYDEFLGDCKMG